MAKPNQDAQVPATESVAMDTRKFLSAINNSAQARVVTFENMIRDLGEAQNADWKLTALQSTTVIFEDADTNQYYVADHKREKGGHIKIDNIRRVQLEESKKSELFEQSCSELIDAIETEDIKAIDSAFGKIVASRFRSTAIPESGMVKTKDGVTRFVQVENTETPVNYYELGRKIAEAISDRIVVNEDGNVEGGRFSDGADFITRSDLGVSELTTRRLVARNMRETAQNAYWNENFQKLVESVAGLICQDNLEQAIKNTAEFVVEYQEFSTLNRGQWRQLIENALTTRGIFNDSLTEDTALLMYKTNARANREDIMDAWTKTAQKAEHPVMLENVRALAESDDFLADYETFLGTIFEVAGDTTIGSLVTGLELLKQKVSDVGLDDGTAGDLDQLIDKLRNNGDSASVWEAMETLDAAGRHMDSMAGLDDFDAMPGPGGMDAGAVGDAAGGALATPDAGVEGGSDKPLEISVKMDPAAMAASAAGGEEDLDADLGGEEEGAEDYLDSLEDVELEGGEDEEEVDELAAALTPESKESDDAITEDGDGDGGDSDDGGDDDDSDDSDDSTSEAIEATEFAAKFLQENDVDLTEAEWDIAGIDQKNKMGVQVAGAGTDEWGNPAFKFGDILQFPDGTSGTVVRENRDWLFVRTEDGTLHEFNKMSHRSKIGQMTKVGHDEYAVREDLEMGEIDMNYGTVTEDFSDADVHTFNSELKGDEDSATVQAAAEAWVRQNRADKIGAVSDPVAQQREVQRMAGELAARREAQRQHAEGIEGEETVDENQMKVPTKQLSRRGLKKSAVDDLVKEGKLEFADRQDNAVLGVFKGVQFTLDNTEEPATLISKNGEVQLDIPEEHVPGALYMTELSEDEAEADAFVEWLDQNIEQLREATIDEEDELDDVIKSVTESMDSDEEEETSDASESASESEEPEGDAVTEEGDDEDGSDDEGEESKSKKPWESVDVDGTVTEEEDCDECDKCHCNPCECED